MSFAFRPSPTLNGQSHPVIDGLAILHKYDVTIDQHYGAPELWVTTGQSDWDESTLPLEISEEDFDDLILLGWNTDTVGWYYREEG